MSWILGANIIYKQYGQRTLDLNGLAGELQAVCLSIFQHQEPLPREQLDHLMFVDEYKPDRHCSRLRAERVFVSEVSFYRSEMRIDCAPEDCTLFQGNAELARQHHLPIPDHTIRQLCAWQQRGDEP